ncbi:MAG: RluA family pseudouridine synthase [Pirellulales bacterium]
MNGDASNLDTSELDTDELDGDVDLSVAVPAESVVAQAVEQVIVDEQHALARLDAFLAAKFPQHSRVRMQEAISAGGATIEGRPTSRPAERLKVGQRVTIRLPDAPRTGPVAEDIPLDVLYEDEHLAVVNKPPGMVVHPAKGHWSGTMAGAIQHRFGGMSTVGGPTRPGIVHRLDRDTSGVIVVARHDAAHMKLAAQFEHREVEKEYFAIVAGAPRLDRDLIDRPIGAHPYQREKMAIRTDHPTVREAQTFYEVTERFDALATVRVLPRTGRTHQIRVHLASIGCPVLCDRLYGGRAKLTRGELLRRLDDDTVVLARQALHARRICLVHPATGERMEFVAPLPDDLSAALDAIRQHRGTGR